MPRARTGRNGRSGRSGRQGPAVAIVTDSTAYLPTGAAESLNIRVVPLQVIVGGLVRVEGTEIASDEVAAGLTRGQTVSTSRPSPSLFAATYREAFAGGAKSIVSVHLSAAMSGTIDAARLAASDVGGDIRVVDSRSVAMGMGFAVLAAAQVAAEAGSAGGVVDADAVVDATSRTLEATQTFFYVDTLEFLRRGGRIGTAQALLGSALAVKPLLCVRDGRIQPLERVRTATKAIARLEEIAVAAAGDDPVRVAVHHLQAQTRAETFAQALDLRLEKVEELTTSEVGAVVGAHTGPGMLGVVICKPVL
ncbi:MAG: DegV family protein [Acidothermaceae bacterium]